MAVSGPCRYNGSDLGDIRVLLTLHCISSFWDYWAGAINRWNSSLPFSFSHPPFITTLVYSSLLFLISFRTHHLSLCLFPFLLSFNYTTLNSLYSFFVCVHLCLYISFFLPFTFSPRNFPLISIQKQFSITFPSLVKSIAFWTILRLLVRATCRWRWAGIIGGMILWGKLKCWDTHPSKRLFLHFKYHTGWNRTRSSAVRGTKLISVNNYFKFVPRNKQRFAMLAGYTAVRENEWLFDTWPRRHVHSHLQWVAVKMLNKHSIFCFKPKIRTQWKTPNRNNYKCTYDVSHTQHKLCQYTVLV
jgi:hypothetical protein